METELTRIPVRSRRQAMDWSLVLVSQGIETRIEFTEEAGWGLAVTPQDYSTALRVLRQYRIENRRWSWPHEFFEHDFLFDWASLGWAVLLTLFYLLSTDNSDIKALGLMDSVAVGRGEWWRLFTAIWLHADLAHLASNATLGVVLLGLVMARYGTGSGLLAAYLAGAGGNLAAWLLSNQPHHSLGASGMVMGSLGLLAIQSFNLWLKGHRSTKYLLTGIAAGLMLFILFGLAPGTDIVAHFGGFVGGLLLGIVATTIPKLSTRSATNLIAGLVFAVLIGWPWWLGWRHLK